MLKTVLKKISYSAETIALEFSYQSVEENEFSGKRGNKTALLGQQLGNATAKIANPDLRLGKSAKEALLADGVKQADNEDRRQPCSAGAR